jgi:nicotinate-nucleotide adenylyltransferase
MAKQSRHIGLLFGSFNPVHVGHLVLANYMRETQNLHEVWMVVSPQNPFKESNTLIDGENRLKMVEIALHSQPGYKACGIELNLPRPSYTINTLSELQKTHPHHRFSIIIGSDNLSTLHRWKDIDKIQETHQFIVYPRPGYPAPLALPANIILTEAPQIDISSTYIRSQLKQGKDMSFFLPVGVSAYISQHHLYQ